MGEDQAVRQARRPDIRRRQLREVAQSVGMASGGAAVKGESVQLDRERVLQVTHVLQGHATGTDTAVLSAPARKSVRNLDTLAVSALENGTDPVAGIGDHVVDDPPALHSLT